MAWNEARATARITKWIESVPQSQIHVEEFSRYVAESRLVKASLQTVDGRARKALVDIPRNRAITTNGVHVYANLIDFNNVLVEAGRETETSHRRALEFLHTHYAACDNLIDEFDMQRVDFHGARLHAVVLTPEGAEQEGERVRIATAFAAAFREMVARIGVDHPEFETGVRIGIDTGPAVAIDSGRGDEAEPLFIGSPANHAARLAVGEEPGIRLSPRAQAVLRRTEPQEKSQEMMVGPLSWTAERRFLDERVGIGNKVEAASLHMEAAYSRFEDMLSVRRATQAGAVFHFHFRAPPLKSILFAEHPPSNAIRMPLASVFADLDGFTDYIDHAIREGRIAEAVANLHVLRAEMAAVLREDFEGRKVRFIGDCVHGLLARGSASATHAGDTIRAAVMAAAGIRSSFELCRARLPGIGDLGVAIGIDFGETPITRIGLRGDESVRTAASRATCVSEQEQRRCEGHETAIGPDAYTAAPANVRQMFVDARKVPNLTHDDAELLLGTMASPYIQPAAAAPMRAHGVETQPMRAHSRR